MKKIKQIVSVVLSLVMLFCMTTTAFAAETTQEIPDYSVRINEYDVYVQTRTASAAQLTRSGMSQQTIAAVKSDAIENELTRLSNLSTSELARLGYSSKQITLLHNYSGERIESNAELRGVFADMTCDFYKVSASTSSLKVKVIWDWTNAPLLAGPAISDIVGIRWQGTNTSGQPLNLALDSAGSSCTLKHYSRSGSYKYQKTASVQTDDPYGHAYAKFRMSYEDGDADGTYYAKSGTFIIKVDRTGSNSIKEAAFVFGYGHTIITVSPSLSLPASFGIGFSGGVEKMCEEAIRMSSSGTITKY